MFFLLSLIHSDTMLVTSFDWHSICVFFAETNHDKVIECSSYYSNAVLILGKAAFTQDWVVRFVCLSVWPMLYRYNETNVDIVFRVIVLTQTLGVSRDQYDVCFVLVKTRNSHYDCLRSCTTLWTMSSGVWERDHWLIYTACFHHTNYR